MLKLVLPFAGAYFLSYFFRTANAVVGPVISSELSLGAADLGLLTSAYFLAFVAAQIPLGMLLDRFGARRVEATLLLFAVAGAALFGLSHSITPLALSRGLIGLGVSACLMAAFKSFSQWYPPDRQAALTGWILTAGTLGALSASAPLDAALQIAGWRDIFFVLAGATLLVSAWIFFAVPEKAAPAAPETLRVQWAGVKQVFAHPHFWRYAPFGFAQIGGFMAIHSLWSTAWLMKVNGHSRSAAADHLAGLNLAMVVSFILIGALATRLAQRGFTPYKLLSFGMLMSLLTLLLIMGRATEHHRLLWIAYGAFSSLGTLSFSLMSTGFPVAFSGRANTAYNLTVFLGAFVLQWGMGVIIEAGSTVLGPVAAHTTAFAVVWTLQAIALVWLLTTTRRSALRVSV